MISLTLPIQQHLLVCKGKAGLDLRSSRIWTHRLSINWAGPLRLQTKTFSTNQTRISISFWDRQRFDSPSSNQLHSPAWKFGMHMLINLETEPNWLVTDHLTMCVRVYMTYRCTHRLFHGFQPCDRYPTCRATVREFQDPDICPGCPPTPPDTPPNMKTKAKPKKGKRDLHELLARRGWLDEDYYEDL